MNQTKRKKGRGDMKVLFLLIVLLLGSWQMCFAQEASVPATPPKPSVSPETLVGKNFFRAFATDPNKFDLTAAVEVFRSSGVTLKYYPASALSAPYAVLRMEGEEYNLFYFGLNPDLTIKEVNRIQASGIADEVALSAVRSLEGIDLLASQFGISLPCKPEALLAFEERKKVLVQKKAAQEALMKEAKDQRMTRASIADSDAAKPVLQAEYLVQKHDPKNPANALKTFGAGPCVIVTIYDSKNKVGMLAHVDAMTDFEGSMKVIREEFNSKGGDLRRKGESGDGGESIRISLVGGAKESIGKVEDIRAVLQQFQAKPVQYDILTGKTESAWLDLGTGEVKRFTANPSLQSNRIPPGYGFQLMNESFGEHRVLKRAGTGLGSPAPLSH
jgi:hypothetical protein